MLVLLLLLVVVLLLLFVLLLLVLVVLVVLLLVLLLLRVLMLPRVLVLVLLGVPSTLQLPPAVASAEQAIQAASHPVSAAGGFSFCFLHLTLSTAAAAANVDGAPILLLVENIFVRKARTARRGAAWYGERKRHAASTRHTAAAAGGCGV